MPRPIRIQYSGAWYHVMNRRAGGERLFLDRYDRLMFLSLLHDAVAEKKLEVHAYCMMGTHYHLLVRTPEPTLDEVMQRIGGLYARYFNDRRDRDGSVCRGRYHAILIDSEKYLLAVSRYIHRNPIDLGVVDLAEYAWSSYAAYAKLRPPVPWLSTQETLDMAGGLRRYEALVESPLPSEVDKLHEQRSSLPSILGSKDFKASIGQRGV